MSYFLLLDQVIHWIDAAERAVAQFQVQVCTGGITRVPEGSDSAALVNGFTDAGKTGNVMRAVDDPVFGKRYVYVPSEVDEETLKEIAEMTGGKFYRARSGEELEQIYAEIDELEKTKIEVHEYIQYEELFFGFILTGLILLLAEMFLGQTVLRKIP